MIITIEVRQPLATAQGVKEDLAMFLERYGDACVLSIKEEKAEQMRIGGTPCLTDRQNP